MFKFSTILNSKLKYKLCKNSFQRWKLLKIEILSNFRQIEVSRVLQQNNSTKRLSSTDYLKTEAIWNEVFPNVDIEREERTRVQFKIYHFHLSRLQKIFKRVHCLNYSFDLSQASTSSSSCKTFKKLNELWRLKHWKFTSVVMSMLWAINHSLVVGGHFSVEI